MQSYSKPGHELHRRFPGISTFTTESSASLVSWPEISRMQVSVISLLPQKKKVTKISLLLALSKIYDEI
jgi:hypothetical protein